MRLHELTPEQIQQWRHARWEAGHSKYGDAHLQRYGLVDVMEELLDARNILSLFIDRAWKQTRPDEYNHDISAMASSIVRELNSLVDMVLKLDSITPDDLCTDERGGARVWWSAQAGERRAG